MNLHATRTHAASGLAAAVLALLLAFPPAALGDADVTPSASNSADFNLGADAVKARDWQQAVYHLEIVAKAEPTNADAQNLLGYAYRNQGKYDLAFSHYNEALRLDPTHRGAREYLGETYLLTGNKAKAQEQLAALERICGKGCEEYQDLAKAIAKAK